MGYLYFRFYFRFFTDFAEITGLHYRTPPVKKKKRLDFTGAYRTKSGKVKCGFHYCTVELNPTSLIKHYRNAHGGECKVLQRKNVEDPFEILIYNRFEDNPDHFEQYC